jgi:ATP-dependent RNA/DNA helicase IGHMBP2
MALLDAVCASMGTCPIAGCKTSTRSTGTTCPFCHLRFCLAHGQAEVHGCGDGARAHARGEWLGGSGKKALGVGTSAMSKEKREALTRELRKKLESGEKERARKGAGGKEK